MYCSLSKALKTTLLTAELYDQEYYSVTLCLGAVQLLEQIVQ